MNDKTSNRNRVTAGAEVVAEKHPKEKNDEIAWTTGDETKEELEKRKIRLELLNLARPWWRRTQSIVAMLGLVAMFGGWIVTAVHSNINAKMEIVRLDNQIASLEENIISLEENRKMLIVQEETLIASLEQKQAEIDPSVSIELFGQVIDADTGIPIVGVLVEVSSNIENGGVVRHQTTTNGQFSIPVPDVKELRLTAIAAGYQSFRTLIVQLKDESKPINIRLKRRELPDAQQ